MKDFDHWPLIEGASVPLRRHIAAPDHSDKLEWGVHSADGSIDGIKFDLRVGMGCNLEVQFGSLDDKDGGWRYYLDVKDLIRAAVTQYKKDKNL